MATDVAFSMKHYATAIAGVALSATVSIQGAITMAGWLATPYQIHGPVFTQQNSYPMLAAATIFEPDSNKAIPDKSEETGDWELRDIGEKYSATPHASAVPVEPETVELALRLGQNVNLDKTGIDPVKVGGIRSFELRGQGTHAIPPGSGMEETTAGDGSGVDDKAPVLVAVQRMAPFVGIISHSGKESHQTGSTISATLASTLKGNTELASMRARVRAVAEQLPQARSVLLPQISATASTDVALQRSENASSRTSTKTRSKSVGAELDLLVFDGFQGANNIAAAKERIAAMQFEYLALEQSVYLRAVTAHMDVLRDRAIVEFYNQDADFLKRQVQSVRVRMTIGEGTVAELAQAESRYFEALAQVETAQGELSASEAVYVEITGNLPSRLKAAQVPTKQLPNTLSDAMNSIRNSHPGINSALATLDEAQFKLNSARGGALPTASLSASISNSDTRSEVTYYSGLPGVDLGRQRDFDATVKLNLKFPLYQGGRIRSQIREAAETAGERAIQVDTARLKARTDISSNWARYNAAQKSLVSLKSQLKATQKALEAVSKEAQFGQKTLLDILDAEAESIAARISVVRAEHDVVISAYGLLAAMGKIKI